MVEDGDIVVGDFVIFGECIDFFGYELGFVVFVVGDIVND